MTIQELREQLKNDLGIIEKFLEVARRNKISLTSDLSLTGNLSAVHLPAQSANGSSNGAPYGIIGPAVARAIKKCPRTYSVRDIDKLLRAAGENISKGQIATALRRFEGQKKIKEVKHGSGRRPNRYQTISL